MNDSLTDKAPSSVDVLRDYKPTEMLQIPDVPRQTARTTRRGFLLALAGLAVAVPSCYVGCKVGYELSERDNAEVRHCRNSVRNYQDELQTMMGDVDPDRRIERLLKLQQEVNQFERQITEPIKLSDELQRNVTLLKSSIDHSIRRASVR